MSLEVCECMSPEHTTRGPGPSPTRPPVGIRTDASPYALGEHKASAHGPGAWGRGPSPKRMVSPPYHIHGFRMYIRVTIDQVPRGTKKKKMREISNARAF